MCSGCVRHNSKCSYSPRPASADPTSHSSAATPNELDLSLSGRRLSSNAHLNLQDLELLHHWLTATCIATSQRPEATLEVQRSTPSLAQKSPFLMHGILAQAATHLARLRPSGRRYYSVVAAKHHAHALPEFRSALQIMDENNHAALIAFSFTLVWCAFARCDTLTRDDSISRTLHSEHWLPDWLLLLRGSCLLIRRSKTWVERSHVLLQTKVCSRFFSTPDHRNITALMRYLQELGASSTCHQVLLTLHHSFKLAWMRESNTPLRNAVNYWVASLPDEYLQALQAREPEALVILSYFCVLVYRSETRWFMRGHAIQLLQSIVERVTDTWKPQLVWPCEEIGLRLFFCWDT